MLKSHETIGVLISVGFGVILRILLLRTDMRQYPTYPHGRVIHISLGVIAAAMGAVAVPALLNKDYTAVTFLSLAAQQFREVRNMERQSLAEVDVLELVPRGSSYIEGIAMAFEGRNYLIMFAAVIVSLTSIVFAWYWGVLFGVIALIIGIKLKSGKKLGEIADVLPGEVRVDGPDVYVDSVYIMNVGLKDNQQKIRQHGMGLIVRAKTMDAKVTISNLGQRQAILHNLSMILGVYRDSGEPAMIPMAKLDLDSGDLGVFILPKDKDMEKAIKALKLVPVLENAVRMPSESSAQEVR
ncbi:YIEGIA family protein [Kroppenstedtia eburnea]|nr:spore envelope protein [Desmospora sp. 8437]